MPSMLAGVRSPHGLVGPANGWLGGVEVNPAATVSRERQRATPGIERSVCRPTPDKPRTRQRSDAHTLVGIGLGLSGEMHLAVALGLVIAYLALSINTYPETQALGRFTLGYGRLGPTEARLLLIGLLGAIALGAHAAVPLLGATLTLLDLATGGAAVAMLVAGAVRAAANLRTLARREPYPAA
jgi:hypothetical protein